MFKTITMDSIKEEYSDAMWRVFITQKQYAILRQKKPGWRKAIFSTTVTLPRNRTQA